MLVCPNCKKPLIKKDRSFVCENRHSFDISKEGYINLLLPNKKNAQIPGDNKEMVNSREEFLNKDYYSVLRDNLLKISLKYKPGKSVILDCGCGTGYYTSFIKKNRGANDTFFGVDISKFATQKAAKKDKDILFFTASVFDLPIKEESIDLVINIFAPKSPNELMRVLKKGGVILEVLPGEDHLIELKEILYKDNVRKIPFECSCEGFSNEEIISIKYEIEVNSHEDLMNLLAMTPYMYKTKQEDIENLNNIDKIKLTIDFRIVVWKK